MLTVTVSHALLAAGLATASEPVDIVRDTWGIPHVFAQTDAGSMFGAGYATAEDRLYQMHRTRMAAKGHLAELEGLRTNPETGETTVDQDIYFRKIRFYNSMTEIEPTLDVETRQFLQAYADGVNYYIQRHQAEIIANPLFHGQLPGAWTPVDCLAAWDRSASHFDGGIQKNEAEVLHKYEAAGSCQAYQCVLYPTHDVMDEPAAVVQQADVPVTTQMAICAFAQAAGFPCIPVGPCGEACPAGADLPFRKCSHAWAVGGAALENGSSIVVAMPQATVFGPGTWHEIHVKGATFDMRGLSFAGSPGFLVGFSRETARGMTGFSIDFSDTFRLKPGQAPDTYEFDGVDYPIQSQNQTVKVRVGPSLFVQVPITVRWAGHIGPIVTDFMLDVQRLSHS